MDILHDHNNKVTVPISQVLSENIDVLECLFINCADVIKQKITIGGANKVEIYFIYIDNMIDKKLLEEDTLRYLKYHMDDLPESGQFDYIKDKGLRTADLGDLITMDKVIESILAGDTVIFVEGSDKAIKVSIRGMANRGVPQAENEVTVRGSKEAFSEVLFINRVLLRRRIKDTKFKIKQMKVGTRTKTDVAICYLEDVAKPEVVNDIEKRLKNFVIDGIFDSGMIEQLTEREHYSPFPEFQATERPDKAASAITEGRVVVIVDNSPMVLLLPTTLNAFFQASDDAYNRWEVATFSRVLRYIAAFLAVALPGLYLAVLNFESELLSSSLSLSFAAAREGVPFSALVEVIIMEIAFELLLEAGIRLPGPMGNTIGIVGGLIIGDAAVAANLVSPMIVIIVALTAISAFTVPNESFANAFRLVRYIIIFLSAWLGLYGFSIGVLLFLIHLCGLKSFGTPYLLPYVASNINGGNELKDAILKEPATKLKVRPTFARKQQRKRLRMDK
ncbi:spore germination protein GerKA [Lachnospiraceae bacterium KM106-2]|nr:spore germination protein GerKA [Lachnospiraceae bacterium KM106-2]